jgi:sn-1 stearoyl-lipid 9-desaturase
MMQPVHRIEGKGANPMHGAVVADRAKIMWNGFMLLSALALGPFFFTLNAFLLFCVLTWCSLLLGHSVACTG